MCRASQCRNPRWAFRLLWGIIQLDFKSGKVWDITRRKEREVSDDVVLDRRVCGLVTWAGLNSLHHVGRDPREEVRSQPTDPGRVPGPRGVCGAGAVAGIQGLGGVRIFPGAAGENQPSSRKAIAGAGRSLVMKVVWIVAGSVLLLAGLG